MKPREVIFTVLCFISTYHVALTADCGTLVAADLVQYEDYTYSGSSNGEICRWKLISAPMEVKVVEASLGGNCQYDNVTLYRGESTTFVDHLKTWCGTDTSSYESVSDNLTVVFYSAGGNTNTRFKLSYRTLYGPDATMDLKPLHKKDGLEGSIIFLNCSATCYPHCRYSWQQDGKAIDFGTDDLHKNYAENDGNLHLHDITRRDAGNYTCTAINPSTSTTWTASLTVLVFYGPENSTSISRIPNTVPVEGEVYSLNCSANCFPACTYIWRFNGSVVQFDKPSGLLEIQNVSLSNAGLYTCTVINPQTGTTGKRSTLLGLFHGPDDTTSIVKMSSSPAVEGQAYSLNCSAVCVPACKYSWSFGGSALQSNSSSGLLVINNVNRSDAGLYTCTAINNESTETGTNSTTVEVLYGPNSNMILKASSPGEEELSRIDINCTASCNPACKYVWEHNGAAIQYRYDVDIHQYLATTKGDLHLHKLLRQDAGTYSCTANNEKTLATWSKSIKVVVFYGPESTSVERIPSTDAVEGQPYRLNCSADCVPPCRYSWSLRGSRFKSNQSSGLLVINSVGRSDAGLYTCTVTNHQTMKEASYSTHIGLYYGPDNLASIVKRPNKTAVVGERYSLKCSADCVPECKFKWTFNGADVVTSDSSGLLMFNNITKKDAGHYTCTASNEKTRDSATAATDIEVYYKPVIKTFDINAHSRSVDVKESDKVDMNCVVDSDPPSTIQLLNGTSQMKETSKSKEIHHSWPQAACEDTGDYFCTADDGISEPTKEKVQLFVQCSPRLNYYSSLISDVSSELGSDAVLAISVIAYPTPVFNWYKLENEQLQLLNTSAPVNSTRWSALGQMILKKIQTKDAGDYQVFVTNGVSNAPLVKKITLTITDDTEEKGTTSLPAVGITFICVAVIAVIVIVVLVVMMLRRRAAANQVRKQSNEDREKENLDPDYLVAVSSYDHLRARALASNRLKARASASGQSLDTEDTEEHYDVIRGDASSNSSNPVYRGEDNSAVDIDIHEISNGASEITPDVKGSKHELEIPKRLPDTGNGVMESDYLTAVDTYGHLRRCRVPSDQPLNEGGDLESALENEGPEQGYKISNCPAEMTLGTAGPKPACESFSYDQSAKKFDLKDHGNTSVQRNSSVNDTIRMFESNKPTEKQPAPYDNTCV